MPQKQIIALGGGGFSMSPDNLALDRYILHQVGQPRPKICFVPTASGDADSYLLNFYRAFAQLNCQATHLSLFRPPTADLESFVLAQDIIYVGGGNTFNMLALWKAWGLDAILQKAYEAGRLLCGISAGANCWFETFSTDSFGTGLSAMHGLGFLRGSFTPHYDGEADRRPSLHQMLLNGKIQPGLAADDGAAVHFVDDDLLHAISERPQARVYAVSASGGAVTETPLQMLYLDSE